MRSHCQRARITVVPKIVDAEEQRELLGRAVTRLVARSGLEAVSLRSVAAEAGVSMGRVQHYFASKDDLLLDALQRAYRRMEERIDARLTDDSAEVAVVTILQELLGEHPDSRDAIRINCAFAARSLDDDRIAAALVDGDEEILAGCVEAVREALAAGRVRDLDPELEGTALFGLARGLGTGVALYGESVPQARRTLTYALRRALGDHVRLSGPSG
jgi:AcrR family transcriptional regulator